MPKTATLKDVLYGLQFGRQQLCRWPTARHDSSPAWSLEPSGLKVPHHIADKAREVAEIIAAPDTKFGESRYQWQSEAA